LNTTLIALFAGLIFAAQSADFSYKARELRSGIWINSSALTLKALRGKVVVIDFWAFDCEPCIVAMPHIKQLYDEYGPEGLVVIGIHTPRADYEKDVSKLKEAITRMGISSPLSSMNNRRCFAITFAISGHRNSSSGGTESSGIVTAASAGTTTWRKLYKSCSKLRRTM